MEITNTAKGQPAGQVLDYWNRACSIDCLELKLSAGPYEWLQTLSSADYAMNPSFDPTAHDAGVHNTHSICLYQKDGAPIATSAVKLLETDCLVSDIFSKSLFESRFTSKKALLPTPLPTISGRIGYSGGTYIRSECRGKRIGLLLTRVARALADLRWSVSHHAGILNRPTIGEVPPYHYARVFNIASGFEVPRFGLLDVALIHITATEQQKQYVRDLALLSSGLGLHKTLALLSA